MNRFKMKDMVLFHIKKLHDSMCELTTETEYNAVFMTNMDLILLT